MHGRYDRLRELLGLIETHFKALPDIREMHIVLLGDLIDRGPQSADVLRLVYDAQQKSDFVIALKGNHEQLMLRALDGEPAMFRAWMRVGGRDTLRSFGITPPDKGTEDVTDKIEELRRAVPREMVDWLRALPVTAQSGDYLFCHAGIRPGVPIKRQTTADLLWIRDEFLEDDSIHPLMVVHGHSVVAEVELRENRVGIDTGAYRTGVLTALYLEGTKREIISTQPDETPPVDEDEECDQPFDQPEEPTPAFSAQVGSRD